MATKVTLRQKAISGNRQSLYLDFYPPIAHPETNKTTRREFLGLYLFDKPKNPFDKQSNNETKQLAENIRAKRQIDIQAENYGFLVKSEVEEIDFLQYFKQVTETKTGKNKDNYQVVFNYLETFTDGKLPLSKLNENLCNDFHRYILTSKRQIGIRSNCISQNTARTYYAVFKAVLKQAYKKGLINIDLSTRINNISSTEVQREHLTHDELQALVNTPCNLPLLKNASLFLPLLV